MTLRWVLLHVAGLGKDPWLRRNSGDSTVRIFKRPGLIYVYI